MATFSDPNPPTVPGGLGARVTRVDGPAKVTGTAEFPSDTAVKRPVYAYLHTSAIALGRILDIDEREARSLPGVIEIMTWKNTAGQVKPTPKGQGAATTTVALAGQNIQHEGEIVAVVLAEDFETARDASNRLKVRYESRAPTAGFGSDGLNFDKKPDPAERSQGPGTPSPVPPEVKVGDAVGVFAASPVKIDQRYSTPPQHHNAMELYATTAEWNGDELTIYEGSQWIIGLQYSLAQALNMAPSKVRIVSPYIGGAFGGKGSLTSKTPLIAIAAKRLGRPVKLVATRDQGFTIAQHRAETLQRVQLAATREGKFTAIIHSGAEVTHRLDDFHVSGNKSTVLLYNVPNLLAPHQVARADRNAPGAMRAPPETPYAFALESAVDEMAYALNMDPVELRRLNDAKVQAGTQRPYSSRLMVECYDAAAKSFGWAGRNPKPGSMTDGDWQVGFGCATASYPALYAPCLVRVTLTRDGARVETSGHEMGTGAYTVCAQTAAQMLGLPLDRIIVRLGDSSLPPAPAGGGSSNTASICNAIAKACDDVRGKLADAAVADSRSPLHGRDPATLRLVSGKLQDSNGSGERLRDVLRRVGGVVEVMTGNVPQGMPPAALARLQAGGLVMSGGPIPGGPLRYSFGAHFVEVRVHRRTREVRVPRAVGAFAAGTIVNPMTARSQLMGGMIWGISAALHEATEMDPRVARYTNDNLAEYLIPVNADVPSVEVLFVAEADQAVNPLGIKGVGELGVAGMNAAVCNAIYHATGVRVRDLPVRIEKLM